MNATLKEHSEAWDTLTAEQQEFARCATDAHYFITNYVYTFDEVDNSTDKLYPDFPYLRDRVIPRILQHGNVYWPKSQRMLITITFCAVDLWLWLFHPGEIIYWTSKNERAVDNGGENSNWNSVAGKIRFMYDRLPAWLKKQCFGKAIHSKFMWKKGTVKNPANENIIMFEAPTASAAAGLGVTRARVDEAANVENLETIHVNLSQSCRNDRHYISYPQGRGNFFAELHFTEGHFDFKKMEILYSENPNYDSEWLKHQQKRLTSFYIAQRIFISFEDSAEGRVWEKFTQDNIGEYRYEPGLPVYLFWDFGWSDYTSVGFACRISETKIRIFDWMQVNHKGYREIARELRKKLASIDFAFTQTGFDSEGFETYKQKTGNLQSFGDPSAKARRESSFNTLQEKYEEQGFPIEMCDSHNSIVVLDKIDDAFERENIEVDEQCEPIIDAGRYWEWPKDRHGVPKPGATQPAHTQFSHAGKALEYGFVMTLMDAGSEGSIEKYQKQSLEVKRTARPVLDTSEL